MEDGLSLWREGLYGGNPFLPDVRLPPRRYDEPLLSLRYGNVECDIIFSPPPAPAETAPAETAPEETAPVETAPVETAPVETAPVETAPVETAPVETAQPMSALEWVIQRLVRINPESPLALMLARRLWQSESESEEQPPYNPFPPAFNDNPPEEARRGERREGMEAVE